MVMDLRHKCAILACILIFIAQSVPVGSVTRRVRSIDGQRGSTVSFYPEQTKSAQSMSMEDFSAPFLESNLGERKTRSEDLRSRFHVQNEDDDEEDAENERLEQMDGSKRSVESATPAIPKKLGRGDIRLPEDYNIYEIPKDPAGNPLSIHIYINVINILAWDELNEMLHADLELRIMWTDYKIMYFNNNSGLQNHNDLPTIENLTKEEIREKQITLNSGYILDTVWKPNLFMENLLSIKQPALMARPLNLKYIPEVGWFEYITRLSVKMDCEMDFHHYPADTQECKFSLRPFAHAKKDMQLHWYKNGVFLNDLTLPSFDVVIKSTNKHDRYLHKNMEKDPDDLFEVLTFVLAARRQLSYHIVQTYLASTFYIVITTLCFLLPARMIEARIGITMTTLLTLTAMFAAVRSSTPIVSYVKAIDIWIVGCIFFVFLVLAQFTIHTRITTGDDEDDDEDDEGPHHRRKKSLRRSASNSGGLGNGNGEKEPLESHASNGRGRSGSKLPSSRAMEWANVSERHAFHAFLIIFLVYSIIYWSWLLTSSDYFNWKINSTLNDVVDFSDD